MSSQGPFYTPGSYIAEAVSQGFSKSRKGNQQFVLRFKVLGTPDGDSIMPVAQEYERTCWMPITEKTAERVADALRQIGYTGKSFGPLDPNHPQHFSFTGNQIEVYCQHETDLNGILREKWQISTNAPALKVEPLSPKDIRELDSLFGKELAKGATATAPARSAPTSTVITDDDIPF